MKSATPAPPTDAPTANPSDIYSSLLCMDPIPPLDLHPLLRYLDDAFTAIDQWLLKPPSPVSSPVKAGINNADPTLHKQLKTLALTEQVTLQELTGRALAEFLENRRTNAPGLGIGRRAHLVSAGIASAHKPNGATVPIVTIHHPGAGDTPGPIDSYRSHEVSSLLHDIETHAIEHIEARSAWRTWTKSPQAVEEVRIMLRKQDAPDLHLHCELDADGALIASRALLRREDSEVHLNPLATATVRKLCRAVTPKIA